MKIKIISLFGSIIIHSMFLLLFGIFMQSFVFPSEMPVMVTIDIESVRSGNAFLFPAQTIENERSLSKAQNKSQYGYKSRYTADLQTRMASIKRKYAVEEIDMPVVRSKCEQIFVKSKELSEMSRSEIDAELVKIDSETYEKIRGDILEKSKGIHDKGNDIWMEMNNTPKHETQVVFVDMGNAYAWYRKINETTFILTNNEELNRMGLRSGFYVHDRNGYYKSIAKILGVSPKNIKQVNGFVPAWYLVYDLAKEMVVLDMVIKRYGDRPTILYRREVDTPNGPIIVFERAEFKSGMSISIEDPEVKQLLSKKNAQRT